MIAALPGWRTTLHGDTCVLAPIDAPHAASIRYRERVRPMCPLRQRVAGAARTLGVVSPVVERLITVEGEYAALCHLEGTDERDGKRWLVSVGLVFGDDFQSELWGRSDSPAHFDALRAAVRRLLETDSHLLGARRRRFAYTPPPGWDGFPQLFHTVWVPPEYPRTKSELVVYPAIPGGRGSAASSAATIAGTALGAASSVVFGGFHGLRFALPDRELVALEDGHFVYVVDAVGAPARAVLDDVLGTIEPLPRPRRSATAGSAMAEMYCD